MRCIKQKKPDVIKFVPPKISSYSLNCLTQDSRALTFDLIFLT